MRKVISVNLELSVVNFLEQLSKVECRNKSNLVNEIVKKHYEGLTLKQKMKMLRIENFEGGVK
jgi:predicted DNA-binding protein